MSDNEKKYWFRAKRYGWGWGLPVMWQGWVVLAVWLAAVTLSVPWMAAGNTAAYLSFVAVMTAILIAICYAKGEPPRWRWGGK